MASLEQSFQNCSLNRSSSPRLGRAEDNDEEEDLTSNTNTALELNSHISLPYQWEQCLDLKTGEIYYINWQDGTKKKDDPRKKAANGGRDSYFSEEEEEEEVEDDDNAYDSESDGSSSVSSPFSFKEDYTNNNHQEGGDHILVVAGCKSCMMYFMVPKRVQECPKCNGFLLHFDRFGNGSL